MRGRELVPEPFRSLLRRFRRPSSPPAIWGGVYRSFAEIPGDESPYRTADALDAAERLLRETEREPMPQEAELDHHVLALAVRLSNLAEIRVSDFGGGVGQSYSALRRMVAPDIALHYQVIELAEVVERGRQIWRGNSHIEFAADVGESRAPDIVFAKGVIQYFADYASLLRRLFACRARWVLLEKLPGVNCASYATVQLNVHGGRMPYWMLNVDELETVGRSEGYRVVLRRRLERRYDQSEFPSDLRMERATSLLFERI